MNPEQVVDLVNEEVFEGNEIVFLNEDGTLSFLKKGTGKVSFPYKTPSFGPKSLLIIIGIELKLRIIRGLMRFDMDNLVRKMNELREKICQST